MKTEGHAPGFHAFAQQTLLNARSRRVLEKCGFAYEGRLHRAELLWNGEVRDHLLFYLPHEVLQANTK